MNNHNYIGSSFFIVTLDFNYSYVKETPEEHAIEMVKQSTKYLGNYEVQKRIDKMKKGMTLRRQLSNAVLVNLPPIK